MTNDGSWKKQTEKHKTDAALKNVLIEFNSIHLDIT